MGLICVWFMAVGGMLLVLPGLLAPFPPLEFSSNIKWEFGLALGIIGLLLTVKAEGNDAGAGYTYSEVNGLQRHGNVLLITAIVLFVVGIGICIHGDMAVGMATRYLVGVAAILLAGIAPISWAHAVEYDTLS